MHRTYKLTEVFLHLTSMGRFHTANHVTTTESWQDNISFAFQSKQIHMKEKGKLRDCGQYSEFTTRSL